VRQWPQQHACKKQAAAATTISLISNALALSYITMVLLSDSKQ
jgi:hypothetical protein